MKKFLAILLALLTLSAMSISVSAATAFSDFKLDHYFIMNFDDPDGVFASDKYFNWGYCGGLTAAEGSVKIPKGTAAHTEMSIGHAANIGKDGGYAYWITGTLSYVAITYKTAADGSIGLKFAPTEAKWNSTPAWAPEDYQVVSLPASEEFTTVIVPLDEAVQWDEPLFLFAFTSGGSVTVEDEAAEEDNSEEEAEPEVVAEDIYIKSIGFFVSEEEVADYYDPNKPESTTPETTKAPETTDTKPADTTTPEESTSAPDTDAASDTTKADKDDSSVSVVTIAIVIAVIVVIAGAVVAVVIVKKRKK